MKELENSNSARRNGNTVVFEPMDLTMKTGRKISQVIAGSFFFGGGGWFKCWFRDFGGYCLKHWGFKGGFEFFLH